MAIWESDEMSQLRTRFADRVVAKKSDYAFDSVEASDNREDNEVTMRDLDTKSGEAEEFKSSNKKRKANKKKK